MIDKIKIQLYNIFAVRKNQYLFQKEVCALSKWWDPMNLFTKLTLVFILPSLLLLIVAVVKEYLKYLDKGVQYRPPGLFSLPNLLIYLVIEGSVGIAFRLNDFSVVASQLIGICCGVVMTLLLHFVIMLIFSAKQKRLTVEYSKFVGCQGTVIKQVGKSGGSVQIKIDDELVRAGAVSHEVIDVGERVTVTDYNNDLLICKKI